MTIGSQPIWKKNCSSYYNRKGKNINKKYKILTNVIANSIDPNNRTRLSNLIDKYWKFQTFYFFNNQLTFLSQNNNWLCIIKLKQNFIKIKKKIRKNLKGNHF